MQDERTDTPLTAERVAEIIDPYAFRPGSPTDRHDEMYRSKALEKAARVVTLLSALKAEARS